MNRNENTKTTLILFGLLIPIVIWLALILAGCYEEGIKLFSLLERLTKALENPMQIHLNGYSLKTVLVFLFLYVMGVGVYFASRENRRPGEEHGSAKWGDVFSIVKRYINKKDESQNLILTQNMRIGLNARKHRRNLNILVIGGSGAGKTRFFAKPNIMQCNTSFIIADPKGGATRSQLKRLGVELKICGLKGVA